MASYNFINLTLKNFLTVGANVQSIDLRANPLTLILGSTNDVNGNITRNGVGKSAIFQALSYAWFGKPLYRIKLKNLVNNINGKNMLVTSEAEVGGKKLRIERGQKPAVLRFFVDGTEFKAKDAKADDAPADSEASDETQGENRQTQVEIERLLGMSHDMFCQAVALNTFTDPFLKMKSNEQREIIEELLGITQLSTKAAELKKGLDATTKAILLEEASIKALTSANDRLNATIEHTMRLADAWDEEQTAVLAALNEAIEAADHLDFDAEIALFEKLDAFIEAERTAKDAVAAAERDLADHRRDLQAARATVAAVERQISETRQGRAVADIERSIARQEREHAAHLAKAIELRAERDRVLADADGADASSCLCCGQPLTGTAHLAEMKAQLDARITKLAADAEAQEAEAGTIAGMVAALREEAQADREANEARVVALTAERDTATLALSEVEAAGAELNDALAAAKAALSSLGPRPRPQFGSRDEAYRARAEFEGLRRDLDAEIAKVNPHREQAERLREGLQEVSREELDRLKVLLHHQSFLHKLLTSKDSFVRKKIIDQNLSLLNLRANEYLDRLGLPHRMKFVADLSVEITLLGREYDFAQMSRGEQNRVILANAWAFRDVWESLNHPINLVAVDELLDFGMDDQGALSGLDVLKRMASERSKNVLLISHKDVLIAKAEHTLLVHKENGFTRFEADATI
jgi:hypothetical protein